jgi:predicted regulator of Ras-like GTPase activity (Roadblock/LC7/MglB family)
MFQELLKGVVESADGGVACVVMDLDGIALDAYAREDAPHDISVVGIEMSVVIKSAKQAATMLEAGEAKEVAVVAEQLTTVARMVAENYFIAVTMLPGGNVGKARFLLRTRSSQVEQELM